MGSVYPDSLCDDTKLEVTTRAHQKFLHTPSPELSKSYVLVEMSPQEGLTQLSVRLIERYTSTASDTSYHVRGAGLL